MVKEKRRILIFSHAMELGGAERVLLGLLEAIDKEQYEIDLFLMRHAGELLKDIPDKIHLLPELPQYASLAVPIEQVLRRRQYGVALGRFYGKTKAKQYRKRHNITGENDIALEYSHKYTRRFMPRVGNVIYDLAISFLTPHYFVRDKVRARKKIAWIHTDYSAVSVDKKSQLSMWAAYDNIISISEQVTESFTGIFPELHNKIIMLPHFMPSAYIRRMSEVTEASEIKKSEDVLNILSIGRFCTQKNFDNIPDICKRILEHGQNVRWYIIGYGDDNLIRQRIVEAKVEDHVIILGKRDNPYPYIKACDIYIQPSRYEGKSVSVIEAQILQKPVIITAYPTAESQLKNEFDGVIVPMDNKGCAEGIVKVILDKELQKQLIANCGTESFDGSKGIVKIYELINSL